MYRDNEPPPKVKKKTVGGPKRALINAGIALAVLCVAGTVALALWPFAAPGGVVYGNAAPVEAYVARVDAALAAKRPVPSVVLTESDLNAFLMRNRLKDESEDGGGDVLRTRISAGRVLLIANEKAGPLHISTRLVLLAEDQAEPPAVDSFWLGHLPLPAFMAKPWTVSLARRFSLGLDRRMWNDVRIQRADRYRVVLGEAPPAAGD